MMEHLIQAGMNIGRLNLSHGTLDEHAGYIRTVREIAANLGRNIAIMIDLPGPKYRTGNMKNSPAILKKGSEVVLTSSPIAGDDRTIPINFPSLYQDVKIGSTILIDDGAIQLRVESFRGKDIVCKVITGGDLSPGRGVVVPGVHISQPFLAGKFRRHLDFAFQQKPDYLALSFVSDSEDVEQVRKILRKKNADIPLIAKIERREAIQNFDRILAVSDGVMVARGDMGVEIPLKEVPLVQKDIIRKCNIAGKAVITATQMLESMVSAPRPTRAEVTDVANAIMDGTDAIMLSAETSIGHYPIQAVKMMYEIAQETERHLPYEQLLIQRGQWLKHQTDELISYNACHTAHWLKAAVIVAFTQSGSTARRVSKYRPRVPVIAITPVKETAGRLVLYWGVQAFQVAGVSSVDDLFKIGSRLVKEFGFARPGDLIIITGGVPVGMAGTTNLLKVQEIH
jgi:pyruvate kinase